MTTKAEKEHMGRVADLGCIACRNMGIDDSPATIHHITHGSNRNHFSVLPLCVRHHFAWFDTGIHKNLTAWQLQHGSETELLKQVESLLPASSAG